MTDVRSGRTARMNEPALPAGLLAVLLAGGALGRLVHPGPERRIVLLVVVGVLLATGGYELWHRDGRFVGGVVAGSGILLIGFGLLRASNGGGSIGGRLVLLLGVAGLVILGFSLVPPLGGAARPGVMAGTGLVFASVLTSGILATRPAIVLLVAAGGTVVAWDMAEHAISLGRQVGRAATTVRATLLRLGMTLLVATSLIVLTVAMARHLEVGLSIGALVLLVLSCYVLLVGLRH